ncbi:hypothetical protein D3C87_755730 [compost metagenome]
MEINGYNLSRDWFDWCFLNPDKIKPVHSALYFFCIEQCNRLGWKEKFGLPTDLAMETIGVKSYNTYINALRELVEFGFIQMIEQSKNQYTSNIIALSYFDKAIDKALDKALIKHMPKQDESTCESIDSIDKQLNNKTINKETIKRDSVFEDSVLSFFGLTVNNNYQQAQTLSAFVYVQTINGRIEYFKTQFADYKKLKADGKYIHSFQNFIGDQKEQFSNGVWDSENWGAKLAAISDTPSTPSNQGFVLGAKPRGAVNHA